MSEKYAEKASVIICGPRKNTFSCEEMDRMEYKARSLARGKISDTSKEKIYVNAKKGDSNPKVYLGASRSTAKKIGSFDINTIKDYSVGEIVFASLTVHNPNYGNWPNQHKAYAVVEEVTERGAIVNPLYSGKVRINEPIAPDEYGYFDETKWGFLKKEEVPLYLLQKTSRHEIAMKYRISEEMKKLSMSLKKKSVGQMKAE